MAVLRHAMDPDCLESIPDGYLFGPCARTEQQRRDRNSREQYNAFVTMRLAGTWLCVSAIVALFLFALVPSDAQYTSSMVLACVVIASGFGLYCGAVVQRRGTTKYFLVNSQPTTQP
jgi:hypothetical protein